MTPFCELQVISLRFIQPKYHKSPSRLVFITAFYGIPLGHPCITKICWGWCRHRNGVGLGRTFPAKAVRFASKVRFWLPPKLLFVVARAHGCSWDRNKADLMEKIEIGIWASGGWDGMGWVWYAASAVWCLKNSGFWTFQRSSVTLHKLTGKALELKKSIKATFSIYL